MAINKQAMPDFPVTTQMLAQAERALEGRNLCASCLGRLFGKMGYGLTNCRRGERILKELGKPLNSCSDVSKESKDKCWLCEGKLDEVKKFADLAVSKLSEWEYSTFSIGTRIEDEFQAREEELWMYCGVEKPELTKSELNREIGKLVETLTGKKADTKSPEIVAIIDTRYDFVTLQVSSLHVCGRYRKLVRDIPQTRWPCTHCRGKGGDCPHCDGKGKMYETSVEELVAGPLMVEAGGTEHAFHGMGREDIDARMLGKGRPFIAEVRTPRRRAINLTAMQERINQCAAGRVEVSDLAFTSVSAVEKLKSAAFPKEYEISVSIPGWTDGMERLKRELGIFRGLQVNQQTPERVAHRRADLIRKRTVLDLDVVGWDETAKAALIRVKAQSGTYIKELVSGDGGRTKPSVSEKLGTPCSVTQLDVLRIYDDEKSQ